MASLAEVAARLPHRRTRLFVESAWPLLLINAVALTCAASVEGRPKFPAEVRARLDAVLSG